MDEAVGERVARCLVDLVGVPPGEPTLRFAVLPPDRRPPRHQLLLDDRRVGESVTATEAVVGLLGLLNMKVLYGNDLLVVHAGAVARHGIGVLLPGASGSGKSTLTAGLVRAGFDYLSDEAVGFDWSSTSMRPYPRPITVEQGSWGLFPEVEPDPFVAGEDLIRWFVPASAIRPDALAAATTPQVLVFPRFEPSAPTELEPLGRAEAVVELATNVLEFDRRPRQALDQLAAVVRGCDCFRLTMGALDPAVDLITDLAGGVA